MRKLSFYFLSWSTRKRLGPAVKFAWLPAFEWTHLPPNEREYRLKHAYSLCVKLGWGGFAVDFAE